MFHSNNQQANGLENGSGLQIESPIHSYCESFFTPVVQFKALVELKKVKHRFSPERIIEKLIIVGYY